MEKKLNTLVSEVVKPLDCSVAHTKQYRICHKVRIKNSVRLARYLQVQIALPIKQTISSIDF